MIAQLYSSYRASHFQYILDRVRDESMAEDILHDAILIMLNADKVPTDGYGYFCGVIKHLISRCRRNREMSLFGDWNSVEEPITGVTNVDLTDLLTLLSERERQAVLLSHIQQLKSESVGRALGLSAAAARKLTQRALEKLRKSAKYNLDNVCHAE